jgi:YVTN family beta-propeller protein
MRSITFFSRTLVVISLATVFYPTSSSSQASLLATEQTDRSAQSQPATTPTPLESLLRTHQASIENVLLVTNWGDDAISLVDIAGGKELAVIHVGSKPYDVKVDASGRIGYVTNSGEGTISVLDVQAMLESGKISVGESPRDIALSADGSRAVVANAGDNSISVVDLRARRELYRVQVGAIPYGTALTNGDRTALVTNWGENTLSIVELGEASGRVTAVLPVGALPYTVVVNPSTNDAYVSNFGAHAVTVIDVDEMRVAGLIRVGQSPWGVASSPDGNQIAIANFYSGDVSLINTGAVANFLRESNASNSRISLERLSPTVTSLVTSSPPGQAPTARLNRASISATVPLLDVNTAGIQRQIALPRTADESPETRRAAKNSAYSRDGRTLVVSDLAANRVIVLDPSSGSILHSIQVGRAPYGLAFLSGQASK